MATPQNQSQLQASENARTELNETVSRLSSHKGVEAVQILNRDGDIVTESGSAATPKQAALVKKLMEAAGSYIQSLEPEDEVSFLQIRSKGGQELMIAPHQGYVLAVLKR
jgi:dynein light chain roadblock-type